MAHHSYLPQHSPWYHEYAYRLFKSFTTIESMNDMVNNYGSPLQFMNDCLITLNPWSLVLQLIKITIPKHLLRWCTCCACSTIPQYYIHTTIYSTAGNHTIIYSSKSIDLHPYYYSNIIICKWMIMSHASSYSGFSKLC